MNESVQDGVCTRTLRLKVRAEAYPWLNTAAVEVNQVFNWGNATSIDAADRNRRAKARWEYKGPAAGRSVQVVSEKYTSVTCSSCGALSGPRGVNGLIVRSRICSECGDSHDRDLNAARNILIGSRCLTSVRGNESAPYEFSRASHRCEAGTKRVRAAAWTPVRP
jgi:hypothetical protein